MDFARLQASAAGALLVVSAACGRIGYQSAAGEEGPGGDGGAGDDNPVAITPCDYEPLRGSVFHVATTGDDASGDGSEDAPWKTLQHAVDTAPDGSTVLVHPGLYDDGRVDVDRPLQDGMRLRSSEPYRARLRSDDQVLTCYACINLLVEGFDLAQNRGGSGQLVHIASPGTAGVTLRNNIIHDTYSNALIRINDAARDVTVERNVVYNADSYLVHVADATDVIVQDNVFFDDFSGSGRQGEAGSHFLFLEDQGTGTRGHTARRNVFLNWEGCDRCAFIKVAGVESAHIENNLLLGNSARLMEATLLLTGVSDFLFRHNTVVGDLPGEAFAVRVTSEIGASEAVSFHNNIWSDPSGTMGAFSDAPPAQVGSSELDRNLYFNGGAAFSSSGSALEVSDDAARLEGDPELPGHEQLVPPVWDSSAAAFSGGARHVCELFGQLVSRYGVPSSSSRAIGAARPEEAPARDILGNLRPSSPALGAAETP